LAVYYRQRAADAFWAKPGDSYDAHIGKDCLVTLRDRLSSFLDELVT
jgi:hypothetical protein